MSNAITPEMERALLDAKAREDAFFDRHHLSWEHELSGKPHPAHFDWARAVEREYQMCAAEGPARRHLDTPIARQAFILGWLTRDRKQSREHAPNKGDK